MLVVIDYDAGNLYNVANALRHLGVGFAVSASPETVLAADRVILPGVGSAKAAMASLRRQGLDDVIRNLKVPFLGICLGMQLLFEGSEEDDTPCLGLLPGRVSRFAGDGLKVPQIGWNLVEWRSGSEGQAGFVNRLLSGLSRVEYFYFVHSYYAPVLPDATLATADYGRVFSAAVRTGNFLGVQFHPERSGEAGLALLRNFCEGG
jgi:imidazole glycerol-phosphate synthase subunit HisH